MWMTLASGAKFGVGFGHHRYSWIYSHKIPRAQEILGEERPVHTAEHLASAMFWLGVPRTEIPRARLIAGRAAGLPALRGAASVCVGSAESLAASNDLLRLRSDCRGAGLEPMILAGPADDASAFAQVSGVSQCAAGGSEEPDGGRGLVHRQRQRPGAYCGGVRGSGGGVVRAFESGDVGSLAYGSAGADFAGQHRQDCC